MRSIKKRQHKLIDMNFLINIIRTLYATKLTKETSIEKSIDKHKIEIDIEQIEQNRCHIVDVLNDDTKSCLTWKNKMNLKIYEHLLLSLIDLRFISV